ncbi:uncharacterized protein LOC118436258 [Folsomia candida]|nr:uncharacterized protein LOC118436258 [Folsomia candida]
MPSSGPQVYKWRTASKIIAIVDLVLSILTICLLALALIFVLFGAKLAIDEFNEDERFDDHRSQAAGAFMIVSAVVFGIAILLVVIDVVAASRLLAATKEGVSPSEALSKAKCWRILNIIFLVFCVLGIFGGGTPSQKGGSMVNAILRGVGVVIVTLFMKELESAATTPQVYYEPGQA